LSRGLGDVYKRQTRSIADSRKNFLETIAVFVFFKHS
jgi:hypothetical protein